MFNIFKKIINFFSPEKKDISDDIENDLAEGIELQSGYNPKKDLEMDSRDVLYGSVEEICDVPDTYLPEYKVTPDYQNGRPFCVSHSVSYLMRLQDNKDYSECFLSAVSEWHENNFSEDYSPTYGTYIKSCLWAAQHKGASQEKTYPPTLFGGDWKELAKYKNIPKKAFDEADKNKIKLYTRIGKAGFGWANIKEIQDAIKKYKGVVIGMRGWTEGWYRDVSVPIKKGPIWYHAIVLNGWKTEEGKVYVRYANWWDPTLKGRWGGYGKGWLKWEDWKDNITGVFTITDHNREDYIKQPDMTFQKRAKNSKDIYAIQNGMRFMILNWESYAKIKPEVQKVEVNPKLKSVPWGGKMIIVPDEDPLA